MSWRDDMEMYALYRELLADLVSRTADESSVDHWHQAGIPGCRREEERWVESGECCDCDLPGMRTLVLEAPEPLLWEGAD